MNCEGSFLELLADAAMKVVPQKSKTRNVSEIKTKSLKVENIEGELYAKVNDVKNFSIHVLFKLFVEPCEERAYICQFATTNYCGTKFADSAGNKSSRLENLVRCHLLEHLAKTRPDVMVKLPKSSSLYHFGETDTVLQPWPENVHDRPCQSIETLLNADAYLTSKDLIYKEHSYTSDRTRQTPKWSKPPELDYGGINIDELDDRIEPSEGLTAYMTTELLENPISLQFVGSDVVITTENMVSVKPYTYLKYDGKLFFQCSVCQLLYLTKKELYVHYKASHPDSKKLAKNLYHRILADNVRNSALKRRRKEEYKMNSAESSSLWENKKLFELIKENYKNLDLKFDKHRPSILKTALLSGGKGRAVK